VVHSSHQLHRHCYPSCVSSSGLHEPLQLSECRAGGLRQAPGPKECEEALTLQLRGGAEE